MRATASNGEPAEHVTQQSIGAVQAQKVKRRIYQGEDPGIAWDQLQTLVDLEGLQSTTVASFVRELAKGVR